MIYSAFSRDNANLDETIPLSVLLSVLTQQQSNRGLTGAGLVCTYLSACLICSSLTSEKSGCNLSCPYVAQFPYMNNYELPIAMAFCNLYGMNKRTVRSVGTSSSQEDMPFIWDIQTSAEASSSHNSHQMQAFCISNSQQPLLCPECQRPCGRRQELKRHLLSFHLPFWIFCPYSRCPWRGHRVEGLKTHLCHQKCGPEPNRKQYEIYDSDLVVGWILDNGTSVKVAADCALAFVQGKAWELQMMEDFDHRHLSSTRKGSMVMRCSKTKTWSRSVEGTLIYGWFKLFCLLLRVGLTWVPYLSWEHAGTDRLDEVGIMTSPPWAVLRVVDRLEVVAPSFGVKRAVGDDVRRLGRGLRMGS
ncbi:hypothetical protein BGW80DRAFT_1249572 [Lactifluus volemus]|nr:hypothetical protein BGW80DRAFT_1249572 [Lactifluus volemus]